MPKKLHNALTDKQIKNAKPHETKLVTLRDGDGLELRVTTAGSKTWYHKYRSPKDNARHNKKLGTYPTLSLKDARELADANRKLVQQRVDPKEHDQQEREQLEQKSRNTVEAVCNEWLINHVEVKGITADYAQDILRSLELYVFPSLGQLPISELTVQKLKDTLQPLVKRGTLETVRRVVSRLDMTMRYAIRREYIQFNPISYAKEEFKKPKQKNLPAIEYENLPELIKAVEGANMKAFVRLCFYLSLHTAVRPANAAKARWQEFDLKNRIWRIEEGNMKSRKTFEIPLTDAVLALLLNAKEYYGDSTYVFPAMGQIGVEGHMSTQSVNSMLRRIGYEGKHTSHGNRTLASTYLHENYTDMPSDVIEAVLSHVQGKVKRAYHRRDYIETRKLLMERWSAYILDCKAKAIKKPSY